MPYIPREARKTARLTPLTEGELNFALTQIALEWMDRNGGVSYTNINRIRGAFVCAADEFYRRVAVPYEDQKRAENGDVYHL